MERLYEWKCLREKVDESEMSVFVDTEVILNKSNIRTRVERSQFGGVKLMVPLKDFQLADDLISGSVTEIIDSPKEYYHVFDENLKYKNKGLYNTKSPLGLKYTMLRRYTWVGILVLLLLVLFRFIRF